MYFPCSLEVVSVHWTKLKKLFYFSKRPTAEECHENRWFMPTDFMIKKRERAIFLGNRLKAYNEAYHKQKAEEADATTVSSMTRGPLARSNSIQEELLTTP